MKKTKPTTPAAVQTPLAALQTATKPLKINWEETTAHPYFRIAFWAIIAVLLIAMPILSFQYGVSGDENVHRVYGEKVLNYFLSFGSDKSYCDPKVFGKVNNLYLYGVSFDLLVACINRIGGITSVYDTRHVVNALSGVFLFLGVGKLGKELGSWRTALFALVLIVLTPTIFGHCMNNLKDIPFTAGYVWSLLYMLRLIKELPDPSRRTLVMLTLAIGLTLSIRVGGLLVFPYIALFVGAAMLWLPHLRADLFGSKTWSLVSKLSLVVVGGYILGIITWPYALEAPLSHPFEALGEMEKFSTSIRLLFEGSMIMSSDVPWYYVPKWFLITAPLFIFVGLAVAAVMVFLQQKNKTYLTLFLGILAFSAVFPVAYAIFKHSPLYDGMRHFLFIIPIFVVISAWGFDSLIDYLPQKAAKYAVVGVVVALCLLPLRAMIANHPYQYIYFNEAFGGIQAAFAKYETDYWMNSIRPMATEFKATHKAELESGKPIIIGTDCIDQVQYEIGRHYKNVKVQYMRYANRSDKPWDYGFFVTRYIEPGFLEHGWYPDNKAIQVAKIDGTPIGTVLARKEGYDLRAYQAQQARNLPLADTLYNLEIAKYPHNEAARLNLADMYGQLNRLPEAQKQLEEVLAAAPTYTVTLTRLGTVYLQQNNPTKAEEIFLQILKADPRELNAAYYLAVIYAQKGRLEEAASYADMVAANAPDFAAARDLQQKIHQQLGH